MDQRFDDNEKLYRAVYPPSTAALFWKKDGKVSSAAFADKKGLSVDRGDFRSDSEVTADITKRLSGRIISVTAGQCREVRAKVCYLPSKTNPYHSEIRGNETELLLSITQRKHLALCAEYVYTPD